MISLESFQHTYAQMDQLKIKFSVYLKFLKHPVVHICFKQMQLKNVIYFVSHFFFFFEAVKHLLPDVDLFSAWSRHYAHNVALWMLYTKGDLIQYILGNNNFQKENHERKLSISLKTKSEMIFPWKINYKVALPL